MSELTKATGATRRWDIIVGVPAGATRRWDIVLGSPPEQRAGGILYWGSPL